MVKATIKKAKPTFKLYSRNTILFGTFLAGPLALMYFLYRNFKNMGLKKQALLSLIITPLGFILFILTAPTFSLLFGSFLAGPLALMYFIYPKFKNMERKKQVLLMLVVFLVSCVLFALIVRILSFLFADSAIAFVGSSIVMLLLLWYGLIAGMYQLTQKKFLEQHKAQRGKLYSTYRGLVISLLSLIITLAPVVFITVYQYLPGHYFSISGVNRRIFSGGQTLYYDNNLWLAWDEDGDVTLLSEYPLSSLDTITHEQTIFSACLSNPQQCTSPTWVPLKSLRKNTLNIQWRRGTDSDLLRRADDFISNPDTICSARWAARYSSDDGWSVICINRDMGLLLYKLVQFD